MKNTRIALRYAKALFDFASEKKIVEDVYHDILIIKDICSGNKDFLHILSSPVIKTDKKLSIIREIFEKHIHPVTLTYLYIITRKRREFYISQIAVKFIDYYRDYKGIELVTITSATEIDHKTREKILEKLKTIITKQIELHEIINPLIIGGLVIQYNNNKLDASISSKINSLSMSFSVNEYIREY